MSSPVKKPFRPSSAFPQSTTQSTTPKNASNQSNQPTNVKSTKPVKEKRMSGDMSFLNDQSMNQSINQSMSINAQSALLASQADRRNKLKKRVLILQTEKIKEMLWEKASLMQKKQLIEEEQRELNSLRQRIELDREERQKRWALEEEMRCEDEDEEMRFTALRMRKFQQRYDFECAKREKLLKSKADKGGRRSATASGTQSRRDEEKEFDDDTFDELIDETNAYEFMSPGGTMSHDTISRGPNDSNAAYSHPSTTFNNSSNLDEYTVDDDQLEEDVDFLSSEDDEDDLDMENQTVEASRSIHDDAHRPLSVSPLPMYSGNDAESDSHQVNEDSVQRAKREADEVAEKEELVRREAEERAVKEREWQALKSRLLTEARELQDKERQRLADEREAEQKRAAEAMAAKEAEMSVLIAKLKDAEHKLPALPALPDASAQSDIVTRVVVTESGSVGETQPALASTSPLPDLSSIILRPAGGSVSMQQSQSSFVSDSVTVSLDEDIIDEPTQAPGSFNPLPSLSAVPQRRLNTNPNSPAAALPKKRETDSAAISSMLQELEELEEEEETMLKMGVEVTKVPRTGKPKVVKLYIDQNEFGEWIVRWDTKKSNKSEACVVLSRAIRVVVGISGGLFTKPENEKRFSDKRNRCFSVIAPDRTLDVCCLTFNDQELWTRTIQRLAKQKPRSRAPEPQPIMATQIIASTPTGERTPPNYAPQQPATHSRASSMFLGRDQSR